jgi:hypothetical protein
LLHQMRFAAYRVIRRVGEYACRSRNIFAFPQVRLRQADG